MGWEVEMGTCECVVFCVAGSRRKRVVVQVNNDSRPLFFLYLGAGPNDWVPYKILGPQMGRSVNGLATGPLGVANNEEDNNEIWYSLVPVGSGPFMLTASASTPLSMAALGAQIVIINDNPTGSIRLLLRIPYQVTDIGGGPPTSYSASLYADVFGPDVLLFNQNYVANNEPTGAWNGLALIGSYFVMMNHDIDGNILCGGNTTDSPANIYELITQSVTGQLQSDDLPMR